MNKPTRPVWAEINLDHLAHNMTEIRKKTPPGVLVTAVVKADAYGHGAAMIGKTLLQSGADRFAVATLSEALQLRAAFPDTEILILSPTPPELSHEVVAGNITQTLCTLEAATALSKAAEEAGVKQKVHIKLDTGMSRIGFPPTPETVEYIIAIAALPNLVFEGLFTHFAAADEADKQFTRNQMKQYRYVADALRGRGITIPIMHACNSAGIIDLPQYSMNMVRAGIILYGLYPSDEVCRERIPLKEVLTLKAKVSHVKTVPAGNGVSYGLKYRTAGPERIATLPIGYADGYTRMLSGKAHVMVHGTRVPVVGRICMDQCMIRVTDVNVNPGDEVTLFGGNDTDGISIDEAASWLGTINYELVCMLDKRIPRVYTQNGRIVAMRDYVREL